MKKAIDFKLKWLNCSPRTKKSSERAFRVGQASTEMRCSEQPGGGIQSLSWARAGSATVLWNPAATFSIRVLCEPVGGEWREKGTVTGQYIIIGPFSQGSTRLWALRSQRRPMKTCSVSIVINEGGHQTFQQWEPLKCYRQATPTMAVNKC